VVFGFELRAYILSHSTSPFYVNAFFQDRFSWTICSGWLWTVILLISTSWVARIIVVSHWCLALNFLLIFSFWLPLNHLEKSHILSSEQSSTFYHYLCKSRWKRRKGISSTTFFVGEQEIQEQFFQKASRATLCLASLTKSSQILLRKMQFSSIP
jgi:hypothetical protein